MAFTAKECMLVVKVCLPSAAATLGDAKKSVELLFGGCESLHVLKIIKMQC